MKATTILSKLEAIAARHEQLWLEARVCSGRWGELAVESCTFRFDHYGADTWVAAHVFPSGTCSDSDWRRMLDGIDQRVVAFLEKEL